MHCAISHQVTKSMMKIEERRSKNILDSTLKVATCKNSHELTNSTKELCLCVASVYNKDYWNLFALFIHVTSVRDLRFESSRTYILFYKFQITISFLIIICSLVSIGYWNQFILVSPKVIPLSRFQCIWN